MECAAPCEVARGASFEHFEGERLFGWRVVQRVPCRCWGDAAESLVGASMVVVLAELFDSGPRVFEACGPVGVKEAFEGLVRPLILSLCCGLSWQARDRQGAMACEEDFEGADAAVS